MSTTRTAEQIREQISALEAELVTLSGEPLLIWTGRDGDVADCPEWGATLTVLWAVEDHSYCEWYPTTEAAKAALLRVARSNGTTPSEGGFSVDLTVPGCHSSRAYVTRLGNRPEEQRSERGSFPPVSFEKYLPAFGWTRIVRTIDPRWSALIQIDCEGDLDAPDGSRWKVIGYVNINAREGERRLGTVLGRLGAVPWQFVPWDRP